MEGRKEEGGKRKLSMSLTLKFSRLTELDIQFITAIRILDAIVVKYTLVSF
jgi:hypothetical protein